MAAQSHARSAVATKRLTKRATITSWWSVCGPLRIKGLGEQLLVRPKEFYSQRRLFIGPGGCLRKDKALKTRMVLLIISIVCLPLSPTNLLRASADEGAGIASIYSSDIGSETASGQKLNPEALTAAHRTLPFGTEVRVTNTNNRRSVLVIINDRGPFVRGRIIDLTPAAARALAFSGLAPVALDLTAPDDDR